MVVGEVGALHRLGDKCPKFEGLVRGLVVEDKIEGGDVAGLFDEEKAAKELLRDTEGGLPNLGFADLTQYPLQNVRHLKGVREVRLVGTFGEGL